MNKKQEDVLRGFVDSEEQINMPTSEDIKERVETIHPSMQTLNNESKKMREAGQLDYLGWQQLAIKDLPSRGLFYPEDTKIYVRAATGGEIKHWSTMSTDDLEHISDHINYIIEKCCKISIPGTEHMGGSWKDLIDIDRLYILFAIRDFTFPKGHNELEFPVSENESIPISKDCIDFIELSDELMQYYNEENRCFMLEFKNGTVIPLYMSSIGTSMWLQNYAHQKQNAREQMDADFFLYAPLLVKNYRKLTTRSYEKMIEESDNWGIDQWSAVSYFRDSIMAATSPVIKYNDKAGMERSAPLTFRGGFKSIFAVSNPLSGLR